MASRPMKRPRISDEDWNDARPHLDKLYRAENRTAKQVAEEMKSTLGATPAQYRSKFNEWGWTKNRKADDTNQVAIMLQQRRPNKRSNVFEWGKQLSEAEVKAIVQRSRPTTLARMEVQNPPPGWVIQTPKQDRTQELTHSLPFHEWEQAILQDDCSPSYSDGQSEASVDPRCLQDSGQSSSGASKKGTTALSVLTEQSFEYIRSCDIPFFTTRPSARSALDSILPSSNRSLYVREGLGSDYVCKMNISFLHRQVLHSLANGFAGIPDFPAWQPLHVLDMLGVETVSRLVLRKTSLTARAIARSLIKGAIELGEHRIIEAILSDKFLAIKIDEEICLIKGQRYTALERAVLLRHERMIEIIIRHGADVEKTFPCVYHTRRESDACTGCLDGALSHYIYSYFRFDYDQDRFETLNLLIQLAQRISHENMRTLVGGCNVDQVTHIINHHGAKYRPWERDTYKDADTHSENPGIADLIGYMNYNFTEDDVLEIFESIFRQGFEAQQSMLSAAVRGGYLRLYDKLCSQHGLAADLETFFVAIECRRKSLVQRLMDTGAFSVKEHDRLRDRTPLSVAIRTRDQDLVELMREKGAFKLLKSWKYRVSAWNAASNVSDFQIINEVLNIGAKMPAYELGSVLRRACLLGDHKLSVRLIELGADLQLGWGSSSGQALSSALKGRHPDLVELLLNAGADPNAGDALKLAVEWGHYPIIERLLKEGDIPCRQSLVLAIERQDMKLVSMMLGAGANINDGALQAAATHGNPEIVQHMLDHGADPNDSEALFESSLRNDGSLCTILEAHKSRYPERQRGFGSKVLVKAIERQDKPMIDLLLRHGADPNGFVKHQDQFITPFGLALTVNGGQNLDLVQQFLGSGCLPNGIVAGIDERVDKTVHRQVFELFPKGDPALPRDLLPWHGHYPAPRVTAFLVAVSTRNTELVSFLARRNASVDCPAQGRVKRSPLQRAAEIGCLPMVELLHNLGADANEKPHRIEGATALQLASIGGFNKIVCYLLTHGARVDAPGATINGYTALEGAAAHGRTDTAHILLEAGAADKGRDSPQISHAIYLAKENGHHSTALLLESRKGNGQMEQGSIEDIALEDFIHDDAYI